MTFLYTVVGWAHVLTMLAALLVCLLHVGRSVWARVLAGAFLLQLVVGVFYQLVTLLSRNGIMSSNAFAVYAVASLLGLVGSIVMVAGLAGVFAQIAGMTERPTPARAPVEPA